ncbi:MAG: 3-deoxy-7-phosphoheptulonate synthase [Gammaproteobacteria bacterium]|nr:3-deoxy-7-phosphoheptulonate synthase [Gammaproteobacteria bacterium]
MSTSTDDVRIAALRPLLPPAILMEEQPVTDTAMRTVLDHRSQATEILQGRDDRLLAIVGPCSIHDVNAAHEYAGRLHEASKTVAGQLLVIMRVYFEKPRTTIGWKGLINDPHLDDSYDINNGLRAARGLLLKLAEDGIGAGTEFLDTITPQFIADLVSWGAIGARTTESQVHRELASGLSMPVGFKNGTDGNEQIAVDAIRAAFNAHHFLSVTKQGISAIVSTQGNDACHIILRGSTKGPNYDKQAVLATGEALEKAGIKTGIMIDCSHGNSAKDHTKQPGVAADIAAQLASGPSLISGVMIESHLKAGNQSHTAGEELVYGQSITDACVCWEDTVPMLETLANGVEKRRALGK